MHIDHSGCNPHTAGVYGSRIACVQLTANRDYFPIAHQHVGAIQPLACAGQYCGAFK